MRMGEEKHRSEQILYLNTGPNASGEIYASAQTCYMDAQKMSLSAVFING